ncbi:Cyclin-like F-box [Beauveria brongniartii RCEF 3172]|uniref:Cyclin-like F-box n=1 Tax=Beauveria brongniartii RCEF 3172 TaxID=1081107 RepID=A0A162JM88_9HYPO|nr:Cyclin-like F-box [Beauveria brongniartii RCEF 3172]
MDPFDMEQYEFDRSLSSRFPERHAVRTFEWHDTETVLDKAGLGKLKVLAFETLQQILVDTDLRGLIRLQGVSKSMKRAVDTIREFHTILRCVPDVIRIMTASKIDTMVSCRDLYNALIQPMCYLCDAPGKYLYLLACHRLCSTCLTTNLRYRPLRPMQAARQFRMHINMVTRLPKLQVPKYSPVGRYCHLRCINSTGWRLIDREIARRRGIEHHGSLELLTRAVAGRLSRLQSYLLPDTRRRERILSYYEIPPVETSWSASVLFPYYDQDTSAIGLPTTCWACRDTHAAPVYMTEECLIVHLRQCRELSSF